MFRRLEPREQRVVLVGAAVSALALLGSYVVVPQVQRWREREALIELREEQLARIQTVLASQSTAQASLRSLRDARSDAASMLLDGGTVAVAASDLQLLLNAYVADSGLTMERVDAVGDATETGGLRRIPARITVSGDIRGLVYLLARFQEGGPFLTVDELRVTRTEVRSGEAERLTAVVGVHGYANPTEGAP